MLQRIMTNGVGLQTHYDVPFGDRLTIFTGDNGLGKTFALDLAWWCLTQTWRHNFAFPNLKNPPQVPYIEGYFSTAEGLQKEVFRSEYSFDLQMWSAQKKPANQAVVIYVGADNSISVWDPFRNAYLDDQLLYNSELDQRLSHYTFKNQDDIWYGLNRDTRTVLCNGLIRDWHTWQMAEFYIKETHKVPSEFTVFRKILEQLSCPGEELKPGQPVRPYALNALDFPSLDCPYGIVPLQFASAGVKRILELAYIITWAWHEHTMAGLVRKKSSSKEITIIVDEIESHLFPKWQRHILPALINVTKTLGLKTQIIMTTHSPLIMASTEEFLNEEQDLVMLFEQHGQEISLDTFPWSRRGTSDNWLTSEIFALNEPRAKLAEEAIRSAELIMENRTTEGVKELNNRLRQLLPSEDLFWPAWTRYLRYLGGLGND